jgi:hypothetical protein
MISEGEYKGSISINGLERRDYIVRPEITFGNLSGWTWEGPSPSPRFDEISNETRSNGDGTMTISCRSQAPYYKSSGTNTPPEIFVRMRAELTRPSFLNQFIDNLDNF